MGRLTAFRSPLAPAPAALGVDPDVRRRQWSRDRDANADWRAWYKTARWQRLREQVLIRDGYRCRKTGVLLVGKHPAPNSPVVDHIVPHRGDEALFWDEANLQSVTKRYHDSVKQALERADQVAAIHPKWLRPSIIPLTIVSGPPAGGKSSYVRQHAGPLDLVIDLDEIAADLSREPLHGWDRGRWLNAALFRRNDLLGDLSRPGPFAAAWFIVAEPKARHRAWWQQVLRPRAVVVIETPEAACLANAKADPGRDYASTAAAVGRWWLDYGRRPEDVALAAAPQGGRTAYLGGVRSLPNPAA